MLRRLFFRVQVSAARPSSPNLARRGLVFLRTSMFGSHADPSRRNIQSCSVAPSSEVATLPAAAASTPGPSFSQTSSPGLHPSPLRLSAEGVWLTSPRLSLPQPSLLSLGLSQGGRQTSFGVSARPGSVARLTITSQEKHAGRKTTYSSSRSCCESLTTCTRRGAGEHGELQIWMMLIKP